mmetsp:Transcript_20827/g.62292  ORF Transcript_20827/g.62292 Transcript_20827/m.62292 type:complete len:176 (+) Transcript_20827:1203-1730(+)
MCLPVFVSSCRRMIVLSGPTYFSRLWCLMELFVFLQTGATLDRVELLAVKGSNFDDVTFQNVDVRRAQCHDPLERDRLLAVIEAGYGDLRSFSFALYGIVGALRDAGRSPRAVGSEDGSASTVARRIVQPQFNTRGILECARRRASLAGSPPEVLPEPAEARAEEPRPEERRERD